MIGNHPNLPENTWCASVELDCGEIGSIDADVEITYTTDGNAYALSDYKAFAWMPLAEPFVNQDGRTVKEVYVDLTDSISKNAIDQVMNDYILS